jgi:hypothetical protein
MKRTQILLVAAGVLILAVVFAQPVKATIATLQSQIAVTIVVNVTPSPIAYAPQQAPAGGAAPSISAVALSRAVPSVARSFQAEGLHFVPSSSMTIAQAQHATLVQAEVTPNPKATMLYSNSTNVTINATAGSTVQIPCAFTVTVDMTSAWSLDEGLSNDFSSEFAGKNLANDSYVSSATPLPTSTPYVVYADDSSEWSVLGSGSAMTTYCVTLTLTVPSTVTQGTYSTNAVYTLYN